MTFYGRTKLMRAAVPLIREQQRAFGTPYMPWPFDKYKRPGSAKYWLSKYPASDEANDQYEDEQIYLDELDDRVKNAAKNYSPSQRWKDAYNEYGWYSDLHVTEFYGNIGGDSSQELIQKYGRGNKINPAHYINPKYSIVGRTVLPTQYVHPDLRKRLGPLQYLLQLPPEEPSVMKFWSPWNLFGAFVVVACSKEYFIVHHDLGHAHAFWTTWAIIISVCVDWWTWWQVLRGQERYDHHYFPLNEKVEDLFRELNKLEDKPCVAAEMAPIGDYVRKLNQRVLDKKRADAISAVNLETIEALETKLKEENAVKTGITASFRETAFKQALDKTTADKKGYMASALKALTGNAEFKKGETKRTSGLTVFKDSYNTFLNGAEQKYLKEQRDAGTLPWVFANEKELAAKRVDPATAKANLYDPKVDAWAKTHHPVTVRTI